MLLWHLGTAALITYVTLGRRRIDYRFVLLGAVLPDLVDALLSPWLIDAGVSRGPAHSLAAVIAIIVVIVGAFRGERRLAVFGLGVGWLLHLVADGMWEAPATFLWPAFGWSFAAAPREPYTWDVFLDPRAHAWVWVREAFGGAVLAWFWAAFSLGRDGRLRAFARDGYLRP